MWAVAGILLGLVVLATLVGLHTGPHAHIVGGALGLLAAAWLLVMAVDGRSEPLLWTLFGVDLVVSAAMGILAWTGLVGQGSSVHRVSSRHRVGTPDGAEGVALSDLTPNGIARVRGEDWSVVSVNGTVRAGARVQVLRANGVRLDVWGEDLDVAVSNWTPGLDQGDNKEQDT